MPFLKRPLAVILAAGIVLACMACSPLSAINTLTPSASYTRSADISYGADPRQKLDIYAPRDVAVGAPVVVFFYGGNWRMGERADYAFVGEALASRGILAVIADYRLYPEASYPGFVEDSAAAVAWTARKVRNYGGNPERLFVMGHSAGAYNAAMVALDARWLGAEGMKPSALRGWIGLAGPYNFLPIENPDVKPVFHFPDTPLSSQPVSHVSAGAPPALLIAAEKDSVVNPARNTGALSSRLRAAGAEVETLYYDRTGHATLVATLSRPLRSLAPVLDDVERFVASHGAAARN
nr:alpha/beta hydrolase [uncultured Noviherbaspirillum sp.]